MTTPTRAGLDRLTTFLAQRLGPLDGGDDPAGLDPARRSVRHMITGIDAYLTAAAAGSPSCLSLRPRAQELWESLQHAAEAGDTPVAPAPVRPASASAVAGAAA
ncbi:hypothetical protein ACIRPK_22610 [Kitasatospora sp. NPDC101801]|uniref:hypothetical protein n=1 Tax=Kitasatospora sp. NPDC101801 TaxID=3364103 RepID=UPI0037F5EF69